MTGCETARPVDEVPDEQDALGAVGNDAAPEADAGAKDSAADTAADTADMADVEDATDSEGAPLLDIATASEDSVQDTAEDTGPADLGTPPPVDAGAPIDAGPPPVDIAPPPIDIGAPKDTAAPLPTGCTQDSSCKPEKSCQVGKCLPDGSCAFSTAEDGAPCENGLPCTINKKCSQGVCWSNSKQCVTTKACHLSKCDAKTGDCVDYPGPPGGWCNDGDPCTGTDRCQADGACKGKPRPDGSSCKGKTPCKTHICAKGSCVADKPVVCEDYNACTLDACDPKHNTCFFTKLANGSACDDGIACTESDGCKNGYCWGVQQVQGCNGLPAGKCGDLVCQKGEAAYSCAVDCLPKGFMRWMLLFTHCKKSAVPCLQDEGCVTLAGCLALCKYAKPAGVSSKKCMDTCMNAADKKATDLYWAADKCSHTIGK